MGVKVLTVEEANRMLRDVDRRVRALQILRREISAKQVDVDLLEIVNHAPSQESPGFAASGESDGELHPTVAQAVDALQELIDRFNEEVDALQEAGAHVKDLDQGLVDFYSLRNGELVWLCWKLGESEIQYWHDLESGFAGRQLLRSEGTQGTEAV